MNGGNYWFIYTLFFIFLLYPLIDYIFRRKWAKVLICLVLIAIYCNYRIITMFQLKNIVYFLPYFIMGNILSKSLIDGFGTKAEKLLRFNVLLMIISIVLVVIMYYHYPKYLRHATALSIILFVYTLAVFAVRYESRTPLLRQSNKMLQTFSKYSLQMYLLNGFFIVIVRTFVIQVLGFHSPLIVLLFMWFGNLILILLTCKILEKNKLTAYICGMEFSKSDK